MRFLSIISKYVILPGAVLYFSGWIYLYTLCRYAGLDIAILNLDTNSIIMNSYNVLGFAAGHVQAAFGSYRFWAGVAVLLALAGFVARRSHQTRHRLLSAWRAGKDAFQNWPAQLTIYALCLLFIASLSQGAAKSYLAGLPDNPGARMAFDFTPDFLAGETNACKAQADCVFNYFSQANNASSLRMLLETTDYYVVWNLTAGDKPKSIGQVYLIKRQSVNLASAQDIETCQFMETSACTRGQ